MLPTASYRFHAHRKERDKNERGSVSGHTWLSRAIERNGEGKKTPPFAHETILFWYNFVIYTIHGQSHLPEHRSTNRDMRTSRMDSMDSMVQWWQNKIIYVIHNDALCVVDKTRARTVHTHTRTTRALHQLLHFTNMPTTNNFYQLWQYRSIALVLSICITIGLKQNGSKCECVQRSVDEMRRAIYVQKRKWR